MENSEILLLVEALVVRLTILWGSLVFLVLFGWRVLLGDLSWMQAPVAIGYLVVLTKLVEHCEQDAQDYYNPRVAEIRRKNDL